MCSAVLFLLEVAKCPFQFQQIYSSKKEHRNIWSDKGNWQSEKPLDMTLDICTKQ